MFFLMGLIGGALILYGASYFIQKSPQGASHKNAGKLLLVGGFVMIAGGFMGLGTYGSTEMPLYTADFVSRSK